MDSDTHNYVWLQTIKEYGDFELRLKFQASRSNKGNSGVQVRSRYYENDEGHKKYNVGMRGHIALQLHKNSQNFIKFKDIEIRPL